MISDLGQYLLLVFDRSENFSIHVSALVLPDQQPLQIRRGSGMSKFCCFCRIRCPWAHNDPTS